MISITAEHLGKRIDTVDAQRIEPLIILEDISFHIDPSDTIAIMGASGSGKSTLLSLMAGLDLPTTGRIIFNNHDLNTLNEEARTQLRGQHSAFIFQQFHLMPHLTALENVLLPYGLLMSEKTKKTVSNQDAKTQALEALNEVGLSARLHHFPTELSGGEQQRVAIARAFVLSPAILFADEPTGNLDTKTGDKIIDLLFSLNTRNRSTLIFVTHDSDLSARCHRQYHLHAGQLHT
jgi:putative ABC transport system ATP-binding protein